MNNASYTDDWRSVITAAYSNYDPVTAAKWSAQLTSWGSGNTYSNQQYFVATRPNPSGATICDTATQSNPYGNFVLKTTTGKYVVASASNTNLVASGTSASSASVFTSAYVPNAGTLKLVSTGQYVTADSSGNYALAAARATASTWEQFIVRPKVGAASGVYSIKATSNGLYVVLGSDGSLINSGATEASSMGFYFTSS
jgi:endo-1,3(4)-beta-glucanase